MHLNDSLGHQEGLTCVYNHHEQACAIAAESYARIHNKIAALCVTTGPGGTNAMTGVVGGFLDSIPMLVISGQVRFDTTARSTGLPLRAMGDQEFDITKSAAAMTKYAEMVTDPKRIRYCLEKAYYIATTGRPGPCWIDIRGIFREAISKQKNWKGLIRQNMKRSRHRQFPMKRLNLFSIKSAVQSVRYFMRETVSAFPADMKISAKLWNCLVFR